MWKIYLVLIFSPKLSVSNLSSQWRHPEFLTTRSFCLGVIVLTLLIIIIVVVLPFLIFWNPIILESFWFPIILESNHFGIQSFWNHFAIILFSWSRISILWVLFSRQINSLVIYLVNALLSRNFCQKTVRVNFRNFHSVKWWSCF